MRAVIRATGREREQREDLVGGTALYCLARGLRSGGERCRVARVRRRYEAEPEQRVAHDAVRRDGEVAEIVVADHAEAREHVHDPEQLDAKQAAAERGIERG